MISGLSNEAFRFDLWPPDSVLYSVSKGRIRSDHPSSPDLQRLVHCCGMLTGRVPRALCELQPATLMYMYLFLLIHVQAPASSSCRCWLSPDRPRPRRAGGQITHAAPTRFFNFTLSAGPASAGVAGAEAE